jgi:hypothetical protein
MSNQYFMCINPKVKGLVFVILRIKMQKWPFFKFSENLSESSLYIYVGKTYQKFRVAFFSFYRYEGFFFEKQGFFDERFTGESYFLQLSPIKSKSLKFLAI